MKPLRLGIVLIGVLLGLAACGGSSEGHVGHGVISYLDAATRKVTLDHDEIPGFMKAMTMMYDVAPGVPLEGLEPGIEVNFWVKEDGGAYSVTEIRLAES